MQKLINIKNAIIKTIGKKYSHLHEPYFDNQEYKEVKKAIKSTNVSTYGKSVDVFENKISRFINAKHALCVNSGTSALHMALKIVGVKDDDIVFMPTLTYVAAANAVKYNGAIPFFLDSDQENYGLCPLDLENTLKKIVKFVKGKPHCKFTKKKISAILVVHVFGYAASIKKILKIAKRFKIPIVEDAADVFGTTVENKFLGTFGDLGILSFNGNKTITSGAGGAIITNNKQFYRNAKRLITVSKITHKRKFIHDQIGWNYKMNALNASLGIAQMNKLKFILKKKKSLHNKYLKNFKKIRDVEIVLSANNSKSNYWINLMKVSNIFLRDKILNYLNKNKIFCRPVWELMHTLPMYKNCRRTKLNEAKKLYDTTICLPSGITKRS